MIILENTLGKWYTLSEVYLVLKKKKKKYIAYLFCRNESLFHLGRSMGRVTSVYI